MSWEVAAVKGEKFLGDQRSSSGRLRGNGDDLVPRSLRLVRNSLFQDDVCHINQPHDGSRLSI
jgi:hypothetical protein